MRTLFFILISTVTIFCQTVKSEDIKGRPIIVIPIVGPIDPPIAAFIGRSIQDGLTYKDPLFIFEIDTFGGRVDMAYNIVDTILTISPENSIAFVKKKAISAGALISLASGKLYMRPSTTIGDCAPLMQKQDGSIEMLGEKFQSPLRAKFRSLAKRNNYPPLLSESMVSDNLEIISAKKGDSTVYFYKENFDKLTSQEKETLSTVKTVVKKGELLTMDNSEAEVLGFSSKTFNTVEEILDNRGVNEYTIVKMKKSWTENFLNMLSTMSPILMMLGMALVYLETKSPGFGLFGILGALCLTLVFGGQYVVGMAGATELFLLFIGLALLAIEVFVLPGFGIIGILGILFIATGGVLAFQDFTLPTPDIPWQQELFIENLKSMVYSLMGAMVLIFLFFKYVFPNMSKVVAGPNLTAELSNIHLVSEESIHVNTGDHGVVTKNLRPAGKAKFKNFECDVISDGEFIAVGEKVIISEIQGNVVKVFRSVSDE